MGDPNLCDFGIMDGYCNIELWIGGKFVDKLKLRYVGGKKTMFDNLCLNFLCEKLIYDMYLRAGGSATNVFFSANPGEFPFMRELLGATRNR